MRFRSIFRPFLFFLELAMKLDEALAKIDDLNTKVTGLGITLTKIGTETSTLTGNVASLEASVANLKAQLAAAGDIPEAVATALQKVSDNLDAVTTQAKAVDDLVPDAPPTPAA
jgi:phage shock protein A